MYNFKKNNEDHAISSMDQISTVLSMVVRGFGFILLLIGLFLAFNVMEEAWGLYKNPIKIEALAVSVEKGSRIDQSINSLGTDEEKNNVKNKNGVRVSYFFAWMIAIIMLLLIGRISLMAIKIGGELVLYDIQVKRFAKELVKESAKAPQ